MLSVPYVYIWLSNIHMVVLHSQLQDPACHIHLHDTRLLYLNHIVLSTLLQPFSNTCLGHLSVHIFGKTLFLHHFHLHTFVCSILLHASMHSGRKKQCWCTWACRHMHSHCLSRAQAHVCASAKSCRYTWSIGLFFCRNTLNYTNWIIGCSFSVKWFLDHLLWHFSNLFLWHHTYPLMCIIFHSNYFHYSHRHHDRRLSLTLTDCQQKAATSERVNPAHRSVPPSEVPMNQVWINSAPGVFFCQNSEAIESLRTSCINPKGKLHSYMFLYMVCRHRRSLI